MGRSFTFVFTLMIIAVFYPAIGFGAPIASEPLLRQKFDQPVFPPVGWKVMTPAGSGWKAHQRPNGAMRSAIVGNSRQSFDISSWLVSPAIDLSESSEPVLAFYETFKFEKGYHHLEILVSTSQDSDPDQWQTLQTLNVHPNGFDWRRRNLSLAEWSGQIIYLALVARIEPGRNFWQIDDLFVESTAAVTPSMPQLQVAELDGQVMLNWHQSSAGKVVVYRAAARDSRYYPISWHEDQGRFNDTRLYNGITYWYRLCRETPEGDVWVSRAVAATPKAISLGILPEKKPGSPLLAPAQGYPRLSSP